MAPRKLECRPRKVRKSVCDTDLLRKLHESRKSIYGFWKRKLHDKHKTYLYV